MEMFKLPSNFKEGKIVHITYACNMIMCTIKLIDSTEVYFHIQCWMRIFDCNGDLIICSNDFYHSTEEQLESEYDYSKTLFAVSLRDHKDKILSTTIKDLMFDNHDIKIIFENGMRMDIFRNVSKYDDMNYAEDYRFFDDDKEKDHYIYP